MEDNEGGVIVTKICHLHTSSYQSLLLALLYGQQRSRQVVSSLFQRIASQFPKKTTGNSNQLNDFLQVKLKHLSFVAYEHLHYQWTSYCMIAFVSLNLVMRAGSTLGIATN